VSAVQRLHSAAVRAQQGRTIVATRRLEDHPSPTTGWHVGGGELLGARARAAEDVRECGIVVRVGHETRAAEGWPTLRVVDGEGGVGRRGRVPCDPDV